MMTRDQARMLIQRVIGEKQKVNEDGLDMCFIPAAAAAHDANVAQAELNAQTGQHGIFIATESQATREELVKGVALYREFMRRFPEIDKVHAARTQLFLISLFIR